MRWPGGTHVLEYHWKNGIALKKDRPVIANQAWGGMENYQFGTDEFLQWCEQMNIAPYINLNMGKPTPSGGTLQEALQWIAYVNSAESTEYGQLRAENGHPEPYRVKYWGLGNESYFYLEKDSTYAALLFKWARIVLEKNPQLSLLAVGHTFDWDEVVLEKCGLLIDYLTQHYYVKTDLRNEKIQRPENTLFASHKMVLHL